MATHRGLTGNRLLDRFAPSRLLPVLAGVSTIGFAGGLLIDRPIPAIVGFMFLGIGLASVVPAVFSAAGRIPGLHAGTAVATASACGWAGFVCGPPGSSASRRSTSVPGRLLPRWRRTAGGPEVRAPARQLSTAISHRHLTI